MEYMVAEFKIDWARAIEDAAIEYADAYTELQCDADNDHQREHLKALKDLRETIKRGLEVAAAPQPAARGVPEGWRLVPAEPTQEMYQSVIHHGYYHDDPAKVRSVLRSEYQDMLAAAPQPAAQPPEKFYPDGIAHLLPPLTINASQISALAALIESYADDPTKICIQHKQAGKDTDGEDAPAGLYAWVAECPEEGSMWLDPDVAPQPAAQPERKPMTDDKAKALIQQRFMTGLNMERDHDVLFRSAGTPSNVWGMDLVWLIRESEAFHGIEGAP